jgi:hypothetical protein
MKFVCVAGFLVVGLGGTAEGAEPGCRKWPWATSPVHPPVSCCPDDYSPKKLPPVPCPVVCRGPNDYCRKTLPTVSPVKYCGVDDYCAKTCPIPATPSYPPWYMCAPAKGSDQIMPGCRKPHP